MQDAIRNGSARTDRRQPFLALGSSFLLALLTLNAAWAGPEGGVIRRGDGNIVRPNATTTNINQQSHRMVIDWQSFNVAANEQVNFHQPGSSSSVLNRIFDQSPSQIFGQINANGRVLLVNANGMYFGESAAVNVGSLIASGHLVNANEFMSGMLRFHAENPGAVINRGLIHAANGGSVGLFGGAVENSGVIIANLGSIELAAGRAATVDFDGDGLLHFSISEELLENVTGADSAVHNTGTLQANRGVIALTGHTARDVFSQVVNNEGIIEARGMSSNGGRVYLTASGGDTINTGVIDVSSDGARGGRVEITGERVGLFGDASIDASGAQRGGTVLIGGDYQGQGSLQRSQMTVMGENASIDVSANDHGRGGTAVLWSDGQTRFRGSINASGGVGGLVETSGKESLDVNGSVIAREWLLDPRNVTIDSMTTGGGGFGGGDPDTFTPNADNAIVNVADLVAALNNGTSVVITTNDPSGVVQNGDITVAAAITTNTTAAATLTLLADGSIFINQGISDTGAGLGVTLSAGGNVTINAAIDTNGAAFNSTGVDFATSAPGDITTGGGDVLIDHSGDVDIRSGINAGIGDIAITAQGGTGISLRSGASTVNLTAATVTLNATAGSIEDTSGGGANNIATASLAMTAANGIGATNDIDAAGIISLSITAGGTVAIDNNNTSALSNLVLDLSPSGGDSYTLSNFDSTTIVIANDGGNLRIDNIANNGNALDVFITASNGDIRLDDAAIANIGAGIVSLTAAGAITDREAGATANITTSGTVTLVAQGGAIGAVSDDVVVSSASALTATAAGLINMTHDSAGATSTTLTSNGNLTYAHTGAGTVTLQGVAANGGVIDIDSASSIVIGANAITADNTVDIDVTGAGSSISVAANGINAAGEIVSLTAGGAIIGTGVAGQTEVTAASLALSAGGAVTTFDTAVSDLAVNATGNVAVTDVDALHVTTVDGIVGVSGAQVNISAGGDLTADQVIRSSTAMQLTTTGGNIGSDLTPVRVNVGDALSVSASGDAYLENAAAGALTLGTVTGVTGAQTLRFVSNGGLALNTALTHATLGDDTLVLNAGGAALNTGGLSVGTGNVALSLIGDTLNLGGSTINAGGGLTVAPGTAGTTIRLGSASTGTWHLDDATIDALLAAGGGTLTIGSSSSGTIRAGNVTLAANQTLSLVTFGDILREGATIAVTDVSNPGVSLSLVAGGNIGSDDNTFHAFSDDLVFSSGGSVRLSGDFARIGDSTAVNGIFIRNNSALELDGVISTAGSGFVDLEVAGLTDVDGNGRIVTDVLTITTNGGNVGAAGAAIQTSVNSLIVGPEDTGDAVGNIYINETDAIALTDIHSTGGVIDIVAGGLVTAMSVSNAGVTNLDDINLTGAGISVGTITANGQGDVTLNAGTGAIADVNGGANNIIADVIVATAATGIDLDTTVASANLDVTGTGNIDIDATDAITLTNVSVNNGNVDISANGIAVGVINAGTTGDVILNAGTGAISDVNGGANNVTAVTFTATAGTGIDLDTTVASTNLNVTGTGDIDIDETDAITLTNVNVNNGNVDISANGIAVSVINAGTTGDVILNAGAGTIADVNGGANNITANVLTATAATGIDLDTTVASANLNVTGTGNIDIDETDAITLTNVNVDDGNVDISANGIAVDVINAGATGDVILNAGTDAITDGNGAATNITADLLIANASAGVNLDTDVTAVNVTVTGGGAVDISEANSVRIVGLNVANGTVSVAAANSIFLPVDISTSGQNILLDADVVLENGDRRISTGAAAGNITVTGNIAGTGEDLALSAGTGRLALAGSNNIGNMTLRGAGLDLAGVLESDTLTLSDMSGTLTVSNAAGLDVSTGGVDLSSFNAIVASANGGSLSIDAHNGTVNFGNTEVGGSSALQTLRVEGSSIAIDNDVTTQGNQQYLGNLVLRGNRLQSGGDIVVTGDMMVTDSVTLTAGRDVKITGTVEEAARGRLVIDAARAATLHGDAALQALTIGAAQISVRGVATSGTQHYDGATTVAGDLSAAGVTFNGSVRFPSGALITSNTIAFNGGAQSVSGGGELTLLPATGGIVIDLGGNGGDMNLDAAALDGYDAGLVIGGTLTDHVVDAVAGTIAVNGDMDVGSGYLVLLSQQDIRLHDGRLAGDALTFVAAADDGRISRESENSLLEGNRITLVAGGGIGEDGHGIKARGQGENATLEVATTAAGIFVDHGNSLDERKGLDAEFARLLTTALTWRSNDNVTIASSTESSANREQGSGLTDEGFIDASLFEDISLFETAGTGIRLPLDQSEEMPEEGCEVNAHGTTRCAVPVSTVARNAAIAPR